MLKLGKATDAARGQVGHIGQLADLVEHPAPARVVDLRIEDVNRHVAAFLVEVSAPQQLGITLVTERGAQGDPAAVHLAVLHHLIDIAATGGHRPCIKRRETGEVVPVVELRIQCAAEDVGVRVFKVEQRVLDLVLLVQRQPGQRPCRHRTWREPGDRGVGGIVGVLLGVVVAGRQLDALDIIDAQPQFAANVVRVGVEQVALTGLWRDAVPVGVIGGANVSRTEVQGVIDLALGTGKVMLQLAAKTVTVQLAQGRYGGQAGLRTRFATGRASGDGDDATGCTGTINSAAATDHFDALDQRRVDVRQVARGVAVGVERNAIDQHQHRTSAQCLAVVGDGAAGVSHTGNAFGQQGGQPIGALAQLLQLLALDDIHLPGLRHQVAVQTRRADFQAGQFHCRSAGGSFGDLRRGARYYQVGVFVTLLGGQPAFAQQPFKRFLQGIAAPQSRCSLTGSDVTGKQDLCRRLARNGIEGLLQRGGWNIEIDRCRLRQRPLAEQQAACQQGQAHRCTQEGLTHVFILHKVRLHGDSRQHSRVTLPRSTIIFSCRAI
ncbi:hypothetical protein D3C84_541790 [compost metagenome]